MTEDAGSQDRTASPSDIPGVAGAGPGGAAPATP